MANPTSNYGWQMPTSTDLVTDLPADFEVFGQAVDTSLLGLKGGTTGQVLSKTSGTDMAFTWATDASGIPATIVDAKGDIIAATAADAVSRLAVGANDTVLTADSTTATGLKWAAASAGGMTELATGSLSGSSVTISSISGAYKNLQLVIQNALPSTQAGMVVRFNSDSGTSYSNFDTTLSGQGTTYNGTYNKAASEQWTSGTNLIVVEIPDYANTITRKLMNALSITQHNATPTFNVTSTRGSWNNVAAITSITMLFYTGTITAGTYILYGVK